MRLILLCAALLFGRASTAVAQEAYSGDAAATYQWVHGNAGPGECGCFSLNGGGVSGSWNVRGPWSVAADFSSQVAPSAPTMGGSLTLTSALIGPRFELPMRGEAGFTARIACSPSRKFLWAVRMPAAARQDLAMRQFVLRRAWVAGSIFRSAVVFRCGRCRSTII